MKGGKDRCRKCYKALCIRQKFPITGAKRKNCGCSSLPLGRGKLRAMI